MLMCIYIYIHTYIILYIYMFLRVPCIFHIFPYISIFYNIYIYVYNSMSICSKNPHPLRERSRQAAAFQVDAQGIHCKARRRAVRLGILRISDGTRGLQPKVHPFCWGKQLKQCQKLTTGNGKFIEVYSIQQKYHIQGDFGGWLWMVYDCFNHIRPFSIDKNRYSKMRNHPCVHLCDGRNSIHVGRTWHRFIRPPIATHSPSTFFIN